MEDRPRVGVHDTMLGNWVRRGPELEVDPVSSPAPMMPRWKGMNLQAETFAAANSADRRPGRRPLAQAWGGLVTAVQGIRFVVPVHSIDARPNLKHFGRRGLLHLGCVRTH